VWKFEYERGLTRRETAAFIDRQMKLWAECGFGGYALRELVDFGWIATLNRPSAP
jgi:hypothetical protein